MFLKSTFVVAAIVTIAAPTCLSFEDLEFQNSPDTQKNISHNLVVGKRDPDDHLTRLELVPRLGSPNSTILIEKTFRAKRDEKITQVLAYDQVPKGKGGYAKLVKGGPGHNNVTLSFQSQVNEGLLFLVQIYSKL
uniref:Salivary secreted peptide n=1 Tax=Bracon brevicornis TaxID=1563983 RepID=A0A6V7IW25_9HYME